MDNSQLLRFKNPVILKDEEGKGKPTIYNLPPSQHTYGKKVTEDPEPIKRVVNGWHQSESSNERAPDQKNFNKLNQLAVQSGITTAKAQKDFRATNQQMVEPKRGKSYMPIYLPDEGFTYGIPNRPSTPVKMIVGNCYALEKELQNEQMYKTQAESMKTRSKLQPAKTKAQQLRQQLAQSEKDFRNKPNFVEPYKLAQFTGSVKVDTRLGGFKQVSDKKATLAQ